ncbi:MAG: LCP family protein [Nocardioides sp.]
MSSTDPARPATTGAVRRHWWSRHRVLAGVLVLATLLVASCGAWVVYLDRQIAAVPRVKLHLNEKARPHHVTGQAATSINILLAGADADMSGGPSIAQSVASGTWVPGSHRSDTIMILHLTADRKHAYLVSVPRDILTEVAGNGPSKINAAFSLGGPSLYVSTLERFTGIKMDHLAIIDWKGFKDLTTALGGVRVYIPADVYDPSQHVQWHKGWQRLEGKWALKYVRMRHGLTNGDFDRIRRQQNFLRATMHQLMSNGTTRNPFRLTQVVSVITRYLTVDSSFTNGDIRSLAFSLRNLSQKDVTFVTVPFDHYATYRGQSVVIPNMPQTRALFQAVAHDNLPAYLAKYGTSTVLGSSGSVS